MRTRVATVATCLVLLALGAAAMPSSAQEPRYPEPSGFIVDEIGRLSPNTRSGLESLCLEVKQKTGAEIAVALVQTIAPTDIDDYANRLFERWGVGSRETNEGVLLVVALDERRIRIEVGYGLEGILPDGRAGTILRRTIEPGLKVGDWDSGIGGGVIEMAQVIAKDKGVELTGIPEQVASRKGRRGSRLGGILGFFILMMILSSIGGRGKRGRRGGMSGWWILPFFLMGGSGGGSHRGGGFGGGGFSGGGFGGFGGGMSGGGGASGGF